MLAASRQSVVASPTPAVNWDW